MGVQERAIVSACPAPSPYALRNQKRNRYMGGLFATFFLYRGIFYHVEVFLLFSFLWGGGGELLSL